MKIKTNIRGWNDVNIATYYKLRDLAEDIDIDEVEKEVKYIAILYNMEEQEIWNLPLTKVGELRKNIQWLNNSKLNKDFKGGGYTINNKDYYIDKKLDNFTFAQFVDFQTYYGQRDKEAELLSTVIIPKGKKYGEGYSIDEVIEEIKQYVSIEDYNSIMYYFFVLSLSLSQTTLTYLRAQRKVEIMRAKITDKLTKAKERIARIIG